MAVIEGEALLVGSWKNVEDLEESLSLEELEAVIAAAREKEQRLMRFYAAFKGVDLDKQSQEDADERLRQIERRAKARIAGLSDEEVEKAAEPSFAEFGIDFVSE